MISNETINFSESYITFLTIKENNYGRFSLESKCTISDFNLNTKIDFYLLSGVIAGNLYSEKELIKVPQYMYQVIFSNDRYKIFRDYLCLNKVDNNSGNINERFSEVDFCIKKSNAKIVLDNEIVSYAKQNARINAKVDLLIRNNCKVEAEFPVKHINFKLSEQSFQVETGPVLIADEVNNSFLSINDLKRVYIYFNNFGKVSFIPICFKKYLFSFFRKSRMNGKSENVISTNKFLVYN